MYFVVKLQNKQKHLVPQKWIKDIDKDLIKMFNYGITYLKKKLFTVYISVNLHDEPDFGLSVLNELKLDRCGCYKASIVKSCGEYISIYSN